VYISCLLHRIHYIISADVYFHAVIVEQMKTVCCSDEKTATTSPDTSLALLQTELAKAEEESEVLLTDFQ